ncbi:autotransporter outer membrane beta-barrel domain-containing protein [Yersinia mollaretii]|uniref:autotransporter outer membrane beta-barrel domain-containing protein n=2 Tax=Yersinia mollaretii TaxID=33060 RepID=UPI0005DF6E9A|nr:autotransporter outer membrane beta-barrel domain-containing protein [Yersinia mollaretii]PJE87928.1 autotransporter outer membrane beta-barrel domain-containing protein [Yersinia mollaretii]CQH06052.1 putative pertactin family virulence factor/autotransporter [Yersinia mollaretii]
MENRINSQITTPRNIKNSQKNRLLSQNKSPIALFIATTIFILGSSPAMATRYLQETIDKDTTLESGDEAAQVTIVDGVRLDVKSNARVSDSTVEKGGELYLNSDSSYLGILTSSARNTKIKGGEFHLIAGEANITDILLGGRFTVGETSTATATTLRSTLDSEPSNIMSVANNGTARDTKVFKGGILFVDGFPITTDDKGVTLENTQVAGELELRSDVTLEGKTELLPTATLKTKGYLIQNNGELIFEVDNDTNIDAIIYGTGSLTKERKKILTLFGTRVLGNPENKTDSSNTKINKEVGEILTSLGKQAPKNPDYFYSGDTNINEGTLKLSNAYFSDSHIKGNKGTNLILEGTTLSTMVQGSNILIGKNSLWMMTDNSSIGDLTLSKTGLLVLSPFKNNGNKLIINGDYKSDSGTLIFRTQLEGDGSVTDHILIEGNTAGLTDVRVINENGKGAATNIGILLIEVRGISDGIFKQIGRYKVGAFDYMLGRGKGNLHKNWYMRSQHENYLAGNTKPTDAEPTLTQSETQDIAEPVEAAIPSSAPITPPAPTASITPPTQTAPTTPPAPTLLLSQPQVYAPENGSYIANIVMARNLFNTRLDDRSGSYQYKDAASGQWRTSSMWMHTQGGRNNFGHAVDQLDIKGKYYSVQLGMDVIQEGRGRIGVLAGLGKATNHSQSKVTGYYSNGSVSGYNLGVYATWLPEQKDNTGFYIDTLAQYSWFNNVVHGQEQAEDKYKSSGFTTSIESGYTFKMATTDQLSYFIQPNAQITLQGIQAQTHKTAYGELISDGNKGHIVTRIGAKTYLQTINSQDSQFTPFISVNWLRQNQNIGTIISGQRIESRSKNSTEFKIGLESQIEQQLHIWATIDYQVGRYNDKNTNALAGIKYHF